MYCMYSLHYGYNFHSSQKAHCFDLLCQSHSNGTRLWDAWSRYYSGLKLTFGPHIDGVASSGGRTEPWACNMHLAPYRPIVREEEKVPLICIGYRFQRSYSFGCEIWKCHWCRSCENSSSALNEFSISSLFGKPWTQPIAELWRTATTLWSLKFWKTTGAEWFYF